MPLGLVDLLAGLLVDVRLVGRDAQVGDAPARGEVVDGDVGAEALVIVDFEVEHSIPLVTPSAFGPPTVTTTQSVIEGNGYGGALGIRRWIAENVELEGQFSRIHTRADVPRTGGKISDSETMLRIGGHVHASDVLSVGGYVSYNKHTDDNFDNIRKLGVSLRYHF